MEVVPRSGVLSQAAETAPLRRAKAVLACGQEAAMQHRLTIDYGDDVLFSSGLARTGMAMGKQILRARFSLISEWRGIEER
jgi:hypothetical protein